MVNGYVHWVPSLLTTASVPSPDTVLSAASTRFMLCS